jgi:serine phosphatase RsbU (regulator of sigma subunit)
VLVQHHQRRPQEIIQAVLSAVADFVGDASQSDDITMVIIRRG